MLCLTVISSCLITAKNHDQIRTQYQEALRDGGNVVNITNQEQNLSAATCERLNQAPDIKSAGGIKRNTTVKTNAAPGVALQSAYITPNFENVFNIEQISKKEIASFDAHASVIFAAAAAKEVGITPGAKIQIEPLGLVNVASILESNARTELIDRWVFIPQAPSGTIAECWIETAEKSRAAVIERLPSVFAASYPVQIVPLRDDDPKDSIDQSLISLSESMPWVFAGFTSLMVALLMRLSRDKIALLHLSGCSKKQVAILVPLCVLIQGTVSLGIGAIALTINTNLSAHQIAQVDNAAGLSVGALVVCVAVLTATTYTMLPNRNMLTLLKG